MFAFENLDLVTLKVLRDEAEVAAGKCSLRYVDACIQLFEKACKDELFDEWSETTHLIDNALRSDFAAYGNARNGMFLTWFNVRGCGWGMVLNLRTGCMEYKPVAVYRKESGDFYRLGLAELAANGIGGKPGTTKSYGACHLMWFNQVRTRPDIVDGKRWLKYCGVCGEIEGRTFATDDSISSGWACEHCAENMETCERCGLLTNDVREVHTSIHDDKETEQWCECCSRNYSFYCEYHERHESHNAFDSYYVVGYGSLCYEGFEEEDIYTCEDCGDHLLADDVVWVDDEPYCAYCAEQHQPTSDAINNYSYKPTPVFINANAIERDEIAGVLYMGIELETEAGDVNEKCAFADEIDSELGRYVYLKEDGSLDNGVEIVTHPIEANYAVDWQGWDTVREIASRHGVQSHNPGTCGLHIHLNRRFFWWEPGIQQDYNVAKFIYLFEKFSGELLKFSRRRAQDMRWCALTHAEFEPSDNDRTIKEKLDKTSCDRYQAINLRNEDTVEVRLWRGTLNLTTLNATLDFTQALARYAVAEDFEKLYDLATFGELLDALGEYAHDIERIKEYAASRGC